MQEWLVGAQIDGSQSRSDAVIGLSMLYCVRVYHGYACAIPLALITSSTSCVHEEGHQIGSCARVNLERRQL